jgi:hypothetical protein
LQVDPSAGYGDTFNAVYCLEVKEIRGHTKNKKQRRKHVVCPTISTLPMALFLAVRIIMQIMDARFYLDDGGAHQDG